MLARQLAPKIDRRVEGEGEGPVVPAIMTPPAPRKENHDLPEVKDEGRRENVNPR